MEKWFKFEVDFEADFEMGCGADFGNFEMKCKVKCEVDFEVDVEVDFEVISKSSKLRVFPTLGSLIFSLSAVSEFTSKLTA